VFFEVNLSSSSLKSLELLAGSNKAILSTFVSSPFNETEIGEDTFLLIGMVLCFVGFFGLWSSGSLKATSRLAFYLYTLCFVLDEKNIETLSYSNLNTSSVPARSFFTQSTHLMPFFVNEEQYYNRLLSVLLAS